MSPNCGIEVEDRFGPIVDGCDTDFDFTLLFEETILFLLPLCVAVVLALFRIAQLWQSRALVKGGRLLPAKLIVWTVAGATQLAFLVLAATGRADSSNHNTTTTTRTRASIAAGCLGLVGMAVLGGLSYCHHRRVVRTSSLLVLYLLATVPMDALRARTLWRMRSGSGGGGGHHHYYYAMAGAITALAASKACVLVLELLWKCGLTYERGLCDAPEESHGLVERVLMLRMLPVFGAGFRQPLQPRHLFPLHRSLLTGASSSSSLSSSGSSSSLLVVLARTHGRALLDPVLPRLCFLALSFAQPFLVRRAIHYTAADPGDPNRYRKGAGLVAAYALVYYGMAWASSLYEQKAARAATAVRADLTRRIYEHSLELDRVAVEARDASTTLMTADMERVQQGIRKLHDAWASLATVGLGLWLVGAQLGTLSLVTLALIGGSLVLAGYWSGRASQYQKVWMEAMERRLHKTVQVLKGLPSIKQMGATQAVDDTLTGDRTAEIRLSRAFRMQLIALVTLSYTSLTMLPALGLAVHVARIRHQQTAGPLLTAVTAFEAMTLFQLVSAGIQEAVAHAMEVMVALGTLQRVGLFLGQHTWTDPRQALGGGAGAGATPAREKEDADAEDEKRDADPPEATRDADAEDEKRDAVRFDHVAGGVGVAPVTLCVPRPGLTVLAGPTGSGKSTLLRLMLGERRPAAGTVAVHTPPKTPSATTTTTATAMATATATATAFCSQTPWIASLSIRDNIVGPLPFQADRYQAALDACALGPDLRALAGGDAHLCGLHGQSLSGGQKVRVALARAVYAHAAVVVLDDCFAGLDVETERQVVERLFGPAGALRQGATTTILATSSLKHVQWAQHVIIIDAHGAVVREGPYADLTPQLDAIREQVWAPAEAAPRASATARPAAPHPPGPSGPSDPSDQLPPAARAAADPAAAQRGANGDMAVYRWYFGAMGWGNFAVFLVLCMLFVFGVIFPQVWLSTWTPKDGNQQRDSLATFFGIFFGVGSLAWLAFGAACVWLFLRIAVRTAHRFHAMLLQTVLRAPMAFVAATDSGATLNRFSQDLQITDMELPLAFVGTTMNILMLVAQCIVVTIGTHYAGLAILAIVLALAAVHTLYLRTSRRLRIMDIESRAPVLSLLLESLDGLPTVRAYGWAPWYRRRGLAVLAQSQRPFHLLQSAQVALNLAVDLFVATLATIVVGIGVDRARSSSSSSSSSDSSGSGIGLALFNIVGLGLSVKGVVYFWTSLEITLGALARIRDFTSETPSEQDPADDDETHSPPPPSWPAEGAIHIQNLTVTHSPAHPPTLKDLSLDIKAGAKVALCGRTGSGKSTLFSALLRLVDTSGGSIAVDGVDIATLSRDEVRSRFVVVPQEALHMSVSVRAYAKLYGLDNDTEVVRGLQDAGLWPVLARGGGLDMLLSEDALSHGQHQLLGLTLARLRTGKVVLMDEPTSHVDADIQARLHDAVFGTFAASTVLCISHQVDSILGFDTVAVLDQGRIVELGNPQELMQQPASCFAQLYSTGELH